MNSDSINMLSSESKSIRKERMYMRSFVERHRYDHATLFFINLIFGYLLFIDVSMQSSFLDFFLENEDSTLLFIIIILGFLSVFYLVLFKKHSKVCKSFAGIYVLILNLFVGYQAIEYSLQGDASFFLLIFPAINVFVSVAILFGIKSKRVKPEEMIYDLWPIKKTDLLVGIIFIPMLLFISINIMRNYWTETFSMCLFYVTFLNDTVAKYVLKRD